MYYEQLNLKGKKYKLFIPEKCINDDTRNLLKEIFGEEVSIFPSDGDVDILMEVDTVNRVNTPNTTIQVGVTNRDNMFDIKPIKTESESDRYMKEHGVLVARNEGRVQGW